MRAKSSSILVILSIIFLLIISIWCVYYISRSWANPHFYEIVLGSIAISLLVGFLPTLIQNFFIELNAKRPKKFQPLFLKLLAAFSCLTASVAIFFYVSNAPKDIKQEIPIKYLFDLNTIELPFLRYDSSESYSCYKEARHIFKQYREKRPEYEENIKRMLQADGDDPSDFSKTFFQNLTEYLIVYCIGNPVTPDGFESPRYREEREAIRRVAYPDNSIRGEIKSADYIKGGFKNNLFYDIGPSNRIELRFPKNTEMTLTRDEFFSSTLVIKNKFLEIRIVVHSMITRQGGLAFLPDSAFEIFVPKEQKEPFKEYDTIIYYKAIFNKWRYGFPEMKYYEEWAEDLLSMLQRKLQWGSPPCLDYAETLKLYKASTKNAEK